MSQTRLSLIESTGDLRVQGNFQKVSVTSGTAARVVDATAIMVGRATGVTVNSTACDSDNIATWVQPANTLITQIDVWCVTAPTISSGNIGYEVGTVSGQGEIVTGIDRELLDTGTTIVINSVAQTSLVQVTQNANTFAVSAQYTSVARNIFCNITNSANAVVATGPRKSRFIMDSDRNRGGALTDYIARVWAPGLAKQFRTGQLGGLRRERINGLEAASAVLPVRLGNQTFDALLVAYRLEGKLYRITGLAPRGSGLLPAMTEAARSFRRLSGAKAGRLREKRISIVTVRGGDTPARLARRMDFDAWRLERFRVLNGLRRGEPLRAGQRVKLVR